jgi:heat shock protein HslJ
MKKTLLFLLMTIFCFSCKCKKNVSEPVVSNLTAQNINRKWMLVKYKSYPKDILIEKKAFLDLTNREAASSDMGCNSLSFTYTVVGNAITFDHPVSTRMYCEGITLEKDFTNDLLKITNIVVEGHKMTLNGDNEKMEFIAEDWD